MDFLVYLLKMSFAFTLFYLSWHLLLKRNTFHQSQRWFLLLSMPASLLLPLAHLPENALPGRGVILHELDVGIQTISSAPEIHAVDPLDYALPVYVTVSLILFVLLTIRLIQMAGMYGKARFNPALQVRVLENSGMHSPSSFFNTLVTGAKPLARLDSLVIKHELVHLQQYHWLDLIAAELFFCLNWFNPLSLFFFRSLKAEHEFIADQHVCSGDSSKTRYAQLLLSEALQTGPFDFHSFSKPSQLKSRLHKLMENSSNPRRFYLFLGAIPFVLSLAFLCLSCTEKIQAIESSPIDMQPHAVFSLGEAEPGKTTTPASDTDKVYLQVDHQPEYPGGEDSLLQNLNQYLSSHFPEEARKKGIEGRVSVNFIVEKDGSISHIQTTRGKQIGYGLAEAAENAVRTLKNFKPGTKNGQPVRVSYTVPVTFRSAPQTNPKKTGKNLRKSSNSPFMAAFQEKC